MMFRRSFARRICVVVVNTALAAFAAGVEEEERSSHGLRLELEVHRTRILPYEPLFATVVAKNQSQDRSYRFGWLDGRFSAGSLCVREVGSRNDWQRIPHLMFTNKPRRSHMIDPGKSHTARAEVSGIDAFNRMRSIIRDDEGVLRVVDEGYPPVLSPSQWEMRVHIYRSKNTRKEKQDGRPKSREDVYSNTVTLQVEEPGNTPVIESATGSDIERSEQRPYQELAATKATPFYSLPAFLRSGEHSRYGLSKPEIRERLTAFVEKYPASRYSLYLRRTYLVHCGGSENEEEKILCDKYRRFLRRHAKDFFPKYMRQVYMPSEAKDEDRQ